MREAWDLVHVLQLCVHCREMVGRGYSLGQWENIDILSCEVEGIVLGVEKVVEYYRGTCFRDIEEVLYILGDCDH